MATYKKEISVTDLQQKILSDRLYNDPSTNEGIGDWVQAAMDGKINQSWKKMQTEWTQKLMDDPSFTDPIPSNQEDFVNLVTARPDYKNSKTRNDELNG